MANTDLHPSFSITAMANTDLHPSFRISAVPNTVHHHLQPLGCSSSAIVVDRRFNHGHYYNGQHTDLPPQFSTDAVARKGVGRRGGGGGGGGGGVDRCSVLVPWK